MQVVAGQSMRCATRAPSGIGRKEYRVNVLGIILARAGSVGLASKHLLPLNGRPVISYTFDHARAARRLTRVVVTSDCPNILRLAQASGFDVVERPRELATSDASVQAVMLHAMH